LKIAVISDLHLGRGDRSDEFGHDDADFLRFLDFVEANHERVVLTGDVWETLQCRSPRQQVDELVRCQQAHPEIARRFEQPKYRYLYGNHDAVARNVLNAPEHLHLNVDGSRFLFTHGHQLDWIVSKLKLVSELIVWLGGWILRMGLKPIKHLANWVEERLRGESKLCPERDRFQIASIALAARHEADVVITGHTHNAVVAEHGDRLFLNPGSCSEGQLSWLSMDTRRGDYSLQQGY